MYAILSLCVIMHTFSGYLEYKEQKMTTRWQRVDFLLVVPYASVISLIVMPSGETTGYVHVVTTILDTAAAD